MSTTALQQPQTGNLTSKELRDTELVEIHKGLFTKLIKEKIPSLRNRKIALRFYDMRVNKDNIRLYYNQKIQVFAVALLDDNLASIVKHNSFQ
jgi:hypothetical protein